MVRVAVGLVALLFAVGPAAAQPEAPLIEEARRFMQSYGRDLARGDRAAIAARYDRTGAFFLVAGGREFVSHADLTRDYRERWTPPTSFEWRELHFDAAGTDAVVVNGSFLWGAEAGQRVITYTGFLRRQDGELRIRLEDETPASPNPR